MVCRPAFDSKQPRAVTDNSEQSADVQGGNPFGVVEYPPTDDATRLLLPPATRAAVAVTIPKEGDLALEMPPLGSGAKTINAPGILYTNDGTENPPAVLGILTVEPSAYSYRDGFFAFPTQMLVKATPTEGEGETTEFFADQPLGGYTSFIDVSDEKADMTREIVISAGSSIAKRPLLTQKRSCMPSMAALSPTSPCSSLA